MIEPVFMKKGIIICLLLVNLIGFSQNNEKINQFDKNGLKVGYWKENNQEGEYIVIPIDTTIDYTKAHNLGDCYQAYPLNSLVFFHYNIKDNLMSVRNGEWKRYKENSLDVEEIEYYKAGYVYKIIDLRNTRIYGNYTEVLVPNNNYKSWDIYLENDNTVSNKTIFCSSIFNDETINKYYPNNNLKLENAELKIKAIYSNPDTVYLKYSTKQKIKIDSITSPNKQLSFYIKLKALVPNKLDSIGIIYKPIRGNENQKSNFVIHTSDFNYKVFLNLEAYDIDIGCFNSNVPIIINKDSVSKYSIYLRTFEPYYLLNTEYVLVNDWRTDYQYLDKNKIQEWVLSDMAKHKLPNFTVLKKGTYYLYFYPYLSGTERKVYGPKKIIIQ